MDSTRPDGNPEVKQPQKDRLLQQEPKQLLNLPRDVLYEIFARVPTKSLYISRCVCKSWHKLITDINSDRLPFFGEPLNFLLVESSENNNSETLYSCDYLNYNGDDGRDGRSGHCKTINIIETGLPSPTSLVDLKVVNSCEGLTCLLGYAPSSSSGGLVKAFAVVCNPVIANDGYVVIELPIQDGRPFHPTVLPFHCAFGYSSRARNFKILLRYSEYHRCYYPPPYEEQRQIVPHRVEKLYTLCEQEESNWKTLRVQIPDELDYIWRPTKLKLSHIPEQIYFNETVHWIDKRVAYYDAFDRQVISFFDFHNEVFGSFACPSLLRTTTMSIGVLRGCLFVSDFMMSSGQFEIWVMDTYGDIKTWTKELVLDTLSTPYLREYPRAICRPLQYIEIGQQQLLLLQLNENLFCYNPVNKKFKGSPLPKHLIDAPRAIAHSPTLTSLMGVVRHNHVKTSSRGSRLRESLAPFSCDIFIFNQSIDRSCVLQPMDVV